MYYAEFKVDTELVFTDTLKMLEIEFTKIKGDTYITWFIYLIFQICYTKIFPILTIIEVY